MSTLRQSGQLVMELEDVSFGYPGKPILKDFSTWIMRGDKIGIVGGNGAGKSTFIKLLMGNLQPHSGTIRRGTHLQTLYFDQLREQIDDEKTIADNVADGNDQVIVSGKPKHIYSYLQDFLFTPERARQLAKTLSGGERHRLLLARLLKNPSNLLVLDEPTNDLDEETLELLEALLVDYPGTLLVVSHDREFLQRTTTSVLAFDRQGVLREFAGGYDDYARYRQREREIAQSQAESNQTPSSKSVSKSTASPDGPSSGKQAKLSFKEQRDLESLPGKIEAWEAELNSLQAAMGDAAFYQKPAAQIAESAARVQELQQEIEQAYERWQALEERRSG
ncbi:MAG: ATP-binding cassette domain-containing protein [Pirellulaceae bacterium]